MESDLMMKTLIEFLDIKIFVKGLIIEGLEDYNSCIISIKHK